MISVAAFSVDLSIIRAVAAKSAPTFPQLFVCPLLLVVLLSLVLSSRVLSSFSFLPLGAWFPGTVETEGIPKRILPGLLL